MTYQSQTKGIVAKQMLLFMVVNICFQEVITTSISYNVAPISTSYDVAPSINDVVPSINDVASSINDDDLTSFEEYGGSMLLYSPHGNIQSPGYPHLSDYAWLNWEIHGPVNQVLNMTFVDFDLAQTSDCTDKLKIVEGSVTLGTYTGTQLKQGSITSSGNSMTLRLVTCEGQSSQSRRGFRISFLAVNATLSTYQTATTTGYNGAHRPGRGGAVITVFGISGNFQSPGYPNLIDNTRVTWEINAPFNSPITITFLDFELLQMSDCIDKLEIYDNNVTLGTYSSAQLNQQNITSTSETVSIVLTSCAAQYVYSRRGISFSYLADHVTPSPYQTSWPTISSGYKGSFSSAHNSRQGVIYSVVAVALTGLAVVL